MACDIPMLSPTMLGHGHKGRSRQLRTTDSSSYGSLPPPHVHDSVNHYSFLLWWTIPPQNRPVGRGEGEERGTLRKRRTRAMR